ncbi:MAG: hypothetical protein RL642_1590 [Bacteroidota bacterium]
MVSNKKQREINGIFRALLNEDYGFKAKSSTHYFNYQ